MIPRAYIYLLPEFSILKISERHYIFISSFVTIQNPIRKIALSELSFCSCGYLTKEIFKIMLIHASMIRKFMKIALALNNYLHFNIRKKYCQRTFDLFFF